MGGRKTVIPERIEIERERGREGGGMREREWVERTMDGPQLGAAQLRGWPRCHALTWHVINVLQDNDNKPISYSSRNSCPYRTFPSFPIVLPPSAAHFTSRAIQGARLFKRQLQNLLFHCWRKSPGIAFALYQRLPQRATNAEFQTREFQSCARIDLRSHHRDIETSMISIGSNTLAGTEIVPYIYLTSQHMQSYTFQHWKYGKSNL